ncbi:hypothetical protein HRbin04_01320 [archaeon HR04]|nr:hypothetical protein HRbin04_01320 [archaeon HR04]
MFCVTALIDISIPALMKNAGESSVNVTVFILASTLSCFCSVLANIKPSMKAPNTACIPASSAKNDMSKSIANMNLNSTSTTFSPYLAINRLVNLGTMNARIASVSRNAIVVILNAGSIRLIPTIVRISLTNVMATMVFANCVRIMPYSVSTAYTTAIDVVVNARLAASFAFQLQSV